MTSSLTKRLMSACLLMLAIPLACMAQPQSPYKGSQVAGMTGVYLYNMSTGMFLQNNRRDPAFWTTRAQLDTSGKDVDITASGDGWQIDMKFGNNHSLNDFNLYTDTSQPVTPWTFTPVDAGNGVTAYTITHGDYALGASRTNGKDGRPLITNKSSEMADGGGVWQIVSAGERLQVLATATADAPQDASWLIDAFDFAANDERNTAWKGLSGDYAIIADNKVSCNRLLEKWNITDADIYQELSLPDGVYELWANACYSPTGASELSLAHLNAYNDGSEPVRGTVYAGNASAIMPDLYAGAQAKKVTACMEKNIGTWWIPAGNGQVSASFFNGYYRTEPLRVRVSGGKLRLGARVAGGTGKSWILVDNFTLSYLGTEGSAFAGNTTATPADGAAIGFDDMARLTLRMDGAATVEPSAGNPLTLTITGADGTAIAHAGPGDATFSEGTITILPAFDTDNYGGRATASLTGAVTVDGQPFTIGTEEAPLRITWDVKAKVLPYLPPCTITPDASAVIGRQQLARVAITFSEAQEVGFGITALASIYGGTAAADGSGAAYDAEPSATADAFFGDWAADGRTITLTFREIPTADNAARLVIDGGSITVDGRKVDEMAIDFRLDGAGMTTATVSVAPAVDATGRLAVSPAEATQQVASCREGTITRVTDGAGRLVGIALPTPGEQCFLTVYTLDAAALTPGTYHLTLSEGLFTLTDGQANMPSARTSHTFTVGQGVSFKAFGTTAISSAGAEAARQGPVFTVGGIRLSRPAKGINIIGRRKVAVK